MEAEIYSCRNSKLITPEIVSKIKLFAKKSRQIKLNVMRAPLFEIIGRMTDFEMLKITKEGCGGYYDSTNKIIAIDERRVLRDDISTLNHEICHFLQDEMGVLNLKKTISQQISYEQQTETMAAILHKEMFPKTITGYRLMPCCTGLLKQMMNIIIIIHLVL